MNNYFYEKSKFYYNMFLKKKTVQKVCAFIRYKNKFLVLVKDGKAFNVGGSVDIGEKTKDAIVREVFEETGGIVVKSKYISKTYYSIEWEFEGKKFPNKRVEYFYLCELQNPNVNLSGIDGEFDKNIKLEWHTVADLKKLNLTSKELSLIEKIVSEKINL